MMEHDPIDMEGVGSDAPNDGRQDGRNGAINPPIRRPYGDTAYLYDIPRPRPDDPPMRYWWVDDEPQDNG